MDLTEARQQAQHDANASRQPVAIWQHTGGEGVPARGTYITRNPTWDVPRFNRWTKIETVSPTT